VFNVSAFRENTRADLVVDNGTNLSRVQRKTGRLRNGSVLFAPCSTYGHHPNPKVRRRTYDGEIEEFAVFRPELGAVYLVPIADVRATSQALLRVTPPLNGQWKRQRNYEIARIDVF